MGQQKLPLGTGNKNAEEREYGPGWRDVADMAIEIATWFVCRPAVSLQPQMDASGRWGLRYVVYVRSGQRWLCGVGCFGPMYPGNGQKTMAAAMWRAYNQLLQAPMGVSEEELRWLQAQGTSDA